MAHQAVTGRMSYATYVAEEKVSALRHEFLNGQVWAMSGGTPEHGALAAALIRRIGNAIDGRPCRVFTSDVRVRVVESGLSTYPDVTVVCGKVEATPEDPDAVTNPIVLAEVLSDSTEAYDRGAKFAHYRRISSLEAYLLVSQAEPRIELYRRTDAGLWLLSEARSGEAIEITPLAISLDVDAIYANPLDGVNTLRSASS
jgi:Uma2 family endonuclease